MDWFLYDSGLRHERVKKNYSVLCNDIAAYGLVVKPIWIQGFNIISKKCKNT